MILMTSAREMAPVILFGGGLDSGAMVEHAIMLGKTPILFHIDYGAKARAGEHRALLHFAIKYNLRYKVCSLPKFLYEKSPLHEGAMAKDHAKNFLPGRNLIFLSIGASWAASIESREVWTGFHVEPPESVYEDAKARFLYELDQLMEQTYDGFPRLVAPFIQREREDYLREAMKTESLLFQRTFSCYESSYVQECGKCTHCQAKEALYKKVKPQPELS